MDQNRIWYELSHSPIWALVEMWGQQELKKGLKLPRTNFFVSQHDCIPLKNNQGTFNNYFHHNFNSQMTLETVLDWKKGRIYIVNWIGYLRLMKVTFFNFTGLNPSIEIFITIIFKSISGNLRHLCLMIFYTSLKQKKNLP